MVLRIALLLTAFLALKVSAQPGLAQNGVVNAASRIPTTLAGGSIARGSLFTIEGVKFGPVASTTAVLKSGTAQVPIKVLETTPSRVNAFMPESAPLGPGLLIVAVGGKESRPFKVEISASNPGIFSRNGEGWGPGRIQNVAGSGARVDNSQSNAAAPGSTIAMLATGLGDMKTVGVLIGNETVQAHARAKGLGEVEIAARIPRNTPRGCYVPVALMPTPRRASNVVTLAVADRQTHCDPGPLPPLGTDKIGTIILTRTKQRSLREGDPDFIHDGARAIFVLEDSSVPSSPLRLLPPPGTCTAYTGSYESGRNGSLSILNFADVPMEWWRAEIRGKGLDAGPRLLLRRGGVTRPVPLIGGGYYRMRLGEKHGKEKADRPLFLDPGPIQVDVPGGRDVRAFTMNASAPAEFDWTDREQTDSIDRAHGFTIHWKAGAPEQSMFLIAGNVDQITTALGVCLCALKPSEGQFTVPPAMLANVPASLKIGGVPYDQLQVISVVVTPGLNPSGLDRGYMALTELVGRYVEYR